MADCVACGMRLEDGITKCPQCGANLARPGAFLQVFGWSVAFASTIFLVVGAISMQQSNYVPLGIGAVLAVLGIGMIIYGHMKTAAVPDPTRPSPPPASAPPIVG